MNQPGPLIWLPVPGSPFSLSRNVGSSPHFRTSSFTHPHLRPSFFIFPLATLGLPKQREFLQTQRNRIQPASAITVLTRPLPSELYVHICSLATATPRIFIPSLASTEHECSSYWRKEGLLLDVKAPRDTCSKCSYSTLCVSQNGFSHWGHMSRFSGLGSCPLPRIAFRIPQCGVS